MKTLRKITACVLAVCLLLSFGAVTGFAAESKDTVGANSYVTAAEAVDAEYAYDGDDLGATYSPASTTFKLWAPTATSVILNRFATGSDKEEGAGKLGEVSMEKLMDGSHWTGVWQCTVDGDIKDTYYTYTVTSIHSTNGASQTAETQDPYSVAVGVNGDRSMVCDLDSTDPDYWDSDRHILPDSQTDSTVWEVHIKDFSWDEASGVSDKNRGKYLAFTETGTTLNNEGTVSTCVDYLKQLGVTTVQINPFYDFSSVNEAVDDDRFNWGYDPRNYNVPEGSYSSNAFDGNVRIKECKQMIQALHNAGISVVMDVVYNHTASVSKDYSCFQATVPDYYYRMKSNGGFSDGSGCGNEVASERAMAREYIVNSCLYWVDEYHIDGFRFDLMGLLDVETMNIIRERLDAVDNRITIWGEGWTGGSSEFPTKTCSGAKFRQATQANCGYLDSRIALFNDSVRNGVKGSVFDRADKGFIAGNSSYAGNINYGVNANTRDGSYNFKARAPEQVVTYAACHDNLTLYDQIMSSTSLADYGVRNTTALKMNRMAAAIVFTSQGIPLILAGEEMARTKYGDENSYRSPSSINKISWNNLVSYPDLVSYYRGLMLIRKNFMPFTCPDNRYLNSYVFQSANLGQNAFQCGFTVTNDQSGQWKKMAVIHNAAAKQVSVTLKDTSCTSWVIIANDKQAGVEKLGEVTGSRFSVPGYSTIIAVDSESFNANPIESNTGTVEVKYQDSLGNKLDEPMIIQGEIGAGDITSPSVDVPNIYTLDNVVGDESGAYSDSRKTVTYVYTDYVPRSLTSRGDINDDGVSNIQDVTLLQKILADIVVKTVGEIVNFDFNYDGAVNISDVTMMQKWLADYKLSTGKFIANYYYIDDNGDRQPIIDPVETTGRVGDDYSTEARGFVGYKLDKDNAPKNASGKIPYGAPAQINYRYTPVGNDVRIHVKHGGKSSYTPYLWIWGSDIDGNDQGNYSANTSWPGGAMTKGDNGWFEYSFTYNGTGTYNLIINDGNKLQTKDYKGFSENELWILIDDNSASYLGDFLKIHAENPDDNPNAFVITPK